MCRYPRYGLPSSIASLLRPTRARPRMKLQGIATTAFFPAALAAASISLALLLLPGAGPPAHSSGVAPALRLVAGDVVAAVEAPVHAIRGHQKPVVSRATRTAIPSHSVPAAKRTASARHRPTVQRPVARQRPLTRTPVATQASASPATKLSRGKAQAPGRLKKLAPEATPATLAGATAQARVENGHGKAIGRPADVPHGPPAAPPGQAKKAPAANKHTPPGDGGGE